MNRRKQVKKLGWALLLGAAYAALNYLTLGLTLPGSALVVSVRPQVVIPILGGFLMGPLHGFVIGCAGNLMGDWLCGMGFVYWPFSLGNGLMGALPGTLRVYGVTRVDSVQRFSMLLLSVVAGNVIGIGLGMIIYNTLCEDSLRQLTWLFFHPIIVVNLIVSFILVPPLLYLFRRMPLSFDIRLSGSLYYLLLAIVLPLILMLSSMNYAALSSGLEGIIPAENIAKLLDGFTLDIFRYGGTIAIAAILAAVGLTFWLIQHLLSPIRSLIRAARQLKDGRLDGIDLDLLAARQDEFGKLAQVFQEAVDQVREREERLRQAIQELRVEINREQEAKQVNEITESEYFRSLSRRSQSLRARRDKNRE
ncbi:MAG: HAMP domain-containing protein [Desulfobacteraceae bacterium]|nr:MAG: HAMP domain-containing protein [Desulfobacteraceae bacterium]